MTLEQYFMGRDVAYARECTDEIKANATDTMQKANLLIVAYINDTGRAEPGVRSGWRPKEVNANVPGAAPHSKHMEAKAIDLADVSHQLKDWCLLHLDVLEEIGLWMEAPECTLTWCHIQTVPPGSGHRVFMA